MVENHEHYISRSIQAVYRRRLIAPFLYIVFLIILWLACPMFDLLFPENLSSFDDLKPFYRQGMTYISADLKDLYFTGYTSRRLGRTEGYYYYTLWKDKCVLVLLSPSTSEEGLPYVETVSVKARIQKGGDGFDETLDRLSGDLDWTKNGIRRGVIPYFIHEPAFENGFSTLFIYLYFATGAYALFTILLYGLYIQVPVLSPPCRRLERFGRPEKLLAQAEKELATLPQLATEDMFITENYFIEISAYGIAIVPIREILWIYKYSTLHKFFWYHFNISYTLHITAGKHLYIQCPKNMKSDIDGIMDYLSEANHDILVGFNEENRQRVQEIQNPSALFEKLIAFLKSRLKRRI